jgi:hypothetical protein
MTMGQRTLVPDASEVVLDHLMVEGRSQLVMVLRPAGLGSVCPECEQALRRIHSRYRRRLNVGEAWGNNFRHRKCLEQANEDLRDQLQKAHPCEEQLHQALKQQRSVINDIHKHVVAVSKALQKHPS